MTTIISDEIYSGRPEDWPVPEGEMHFRLIDSQIGRLDLSCDTGYVIRRYEFSFPEVRQTAYINSLDDGEIDVTQFFSGRAVSLDIVMRNTADIEGRGIPLLSESRMRDMLMRFLYPGARPLLQFSEHGDDRIREIQLRGSDAPQAVIRPKFNELLASWRAPLGVIHSVDTHYAEFSFSDVLEDEYVILTTNDGTIPAHWQLEIEGELSGPRIRLGEKELHLQYDIVPGVKVLVDSRTKTVNFNGEPIGYRYLDDKSEWFKVPPGSQQISVTHDSAVRVGRPYLIWQPESGYLRIPWYNSAGNFISVPDSPELSITGDVSMRATVRLDGLDLFDPMYVFAKGGSGSMSYGLALYPDISGNGNARIRATVTNSSGTVFTFESPQILPKRLGVGTRTWTRIRADVDVNNGAAGKTVYFYKSAGGEPWQLLGQVTSAGVITLLDSAGALEIGSAFGGTLPLSGDVAEVEIRNGWVTPAFLWSGQNLTVGAFPITADTGQTISETGSVEAPVAVESNDIPLTEWAALTSVNVTSPKLPTAGSFANLAVLKASTLVGDASRYETFFSPGEYVVLADDSQAWFDVETHAWYEGYEMYENPIEDEAPPWTWSPAIDDETGEPVQSVITFSYRESYL